MKIFFKCKTFCHLVIASVSLVQKNFFLFTRLVLLSVTSMAGGIIIMPLLSFFYDGQRTTMWYITNIATLSGLLVCAWSICYLIVHILVKQSELEIKRRQAEHRARAEEEKIKDSLFFYDVSQNEPLVKRIIHAAQTLLPHTEEA
jgi:hypothetical protein